MVHTLRVIMVTLMIPVFIIVPLGLFQRCMLSDKSEWLIAGVVELFDFAASWCIL
jgi:hypothetical protein